MRQTKKVILFRSTMDINLDYFPTPMMIWTVFILVLCTSPGVVGGERACKQGFIQYYHARTNGVICCKPVRCDRGQKVTQCSRNETQDTCTACNQHHNQSVKTSSFDPRDCQSYPLNQNCRDIHTQKRNLDDELVQSCMCDVEKGFYFRMPEVIKGAPPEAFCQPNMRDVCQEGYEPTLAGNCKLCDKKYFKDQKGFELCEQKTDCSKMNLDFVFKSNDPYRDNKCSKPVIVTTPKPTTKEPVKLKPEPPDPRPGPASTRVTPPSPTTTAAGSGVDGSVQLGSSLGTNKNHDGDGRDSSLAVPILITVLFLVVVIVVIAVILFYRKRKGLSFCCGSTKTCSDLEKNMRHNHTVMAEPHQRNKIILGNCSSNNRGLIQTGDKVMNNNTSCNGRLPHYSMSRMNGDVPHESVPMHRVNFQGDEASVGGDQSWGLQEPNSQQPQPRVRYASYPGEDNSLQLHQQRQGSADQMFPPSSMFPPSPTRHPANVSPRPGILRNGGASWKHGQVQAMDSIGREKLQVQMLGREANIEAGGENDPLLVSEGQPQLGARRAASPHSAPVHYQTGPGNNGSSIPSSPPLVQGGMSHQRPYLHHPLANSNSLVPEVTFAQQPTYCHHPPKVVATFTRSSSVIATPEGEVDEDDIEANVPRFSQLLPDMDGADSASNDGASPDREEEGVQDPRRTVEESSGATQQLRSPNQRLLLRANPGQERMYHPPAPITTSTAPPPASRRGGAANQADHHIMNLKEQQLQESLTSGPSSSLTSQLKYPSDSDTSQTEALKTLSPEDVEPCTQETTLKTQLSPLESSNPVEPAITNTGRKTVKASDPTLSEETEQKKQAGDTSSTNQSSLERKRNQAARDRRRMASGGSTNSSSSRGGTLDRKRNPSSGEQVVKGDKTLDDSSSPPTSTTVKVPHTSQTVPFDKDKDPGQLKEATHPHISEDLEQTEQKQVSRDVKVAQSSREHSADTSPSRANAYHRSQSENVSSGSESQHKPPPRSNSEEKPQSSNRPVAKVRPMTASDSPVPGKGARPAPGPANILSYSSEEDSESEETEPNSVASCSDDDGTEGNRDNDAAQRREDGTQDFH